MRLRKESSTASEQRGKILNLANKRGAPQMVGAAPTITSTPLDRLLEITECILQNDMLLGNESSHLYHDAASEPQQKENSCESIHLMKNFGLAC